MHYSLDTDYCFFRIEFISDTTVLLTSYFLKCSFQCLIFDIWSINNIVLHHCNPHIREMITWKLKHMISHSHRCIIKQVTKKCFGL